MDVRVDETRQDKLAVEIDDLGLWPDQPLHVGVTANREDSIAGKGDRLLDGARCVRRVDLPVQKDHVRLAVRASLEVGNPKTRRYYSGDNHADTDTFHCFLPTEKPQPMMHPEAGTPKRIPAARLLPCLQPTSTG